MDNDNFVGREFGVKTPRQKFNPWGSQVKNIMKRVVQFGAGNIGRGFLGQLFYESGYEIVFIDVVPELIDALNRKGSYHLRIVGDNPRDLTIRNIRAINAREREEVVREIVSSNLIATAVGARNLPSVADLVAEGMMRRAEKGLIEPVNIIICENMPEASKVFFGYLREKVNSRYTDYLKSHLGLVETVISRMVPVLPEEIRKKDPSFIMAEEYSLLPVDKKGFKGEIPKIKGMIPCENIVAYEEQKLFTHNTGHAICAYLGYQKSYRYIWEAIQDRKIREVVEAALMETAQALVEKHNFEWEEQKNLIQDLLHRFNNKALGDTVVRVGRDPIRKLGSRDRLVGAARLVESFGITPYNVCRGIAAAIFFDYPQDEEAVKLTQMRKQRGVDVVLRYICHINPEGKLGQIIKEHIWRGFI